VDIEHLGAADKEPLQLGLVPVLGHLLDNRKHIGLELVQQSVMTLRFALAFIAPRSPATRWGHDPARTFLIP
jgi:hypothetical protein